MAEKCALCARARAQRDCPALGRRICPLCCGKGRRRSIACPDDCRYLGQGREKAMTKLVSLAGDRALEVGWPDVLHNLRFALVRTRQGRVKDLTDRECLEAVTNNADTLRTKSKGLIYEYRSQDPRVQLVADELARVVTGHEEGQKRLRRVALEDIARCLRYLRRQLEEAGARGVSYLDLAAPAVGDRYVSAEGKGLVEGGR